VLTSEYTVPRIVPHIGMEDIEDPAIWIGMLVPIRENHNICCIRCPSNLCSTLPRELCCVELLACDPSKVAEEDPQISCELFKGSESVFGMDPKLCIGMPASHHKYEVQNAGIVGVWQDAIKHQKDALWCVV